MESLEDIDYRNDHEFIPSHEDDSLRRNSVSIDGNHGGAHQPKIGKVKRTIKTMNSSISSLPSKTKESLSNEFRNSENLSVCLNHPGEDLQFYCFNDNRILCGECLTSKVCAGHNVANCKRASARIKRKADELLFEIENRVNEYSLWEKRIESKQEDLSEVVLNYKEQVVNYLDEIRRKIDAKQEDVLKKIEDVNLKKLDEFEATLKDIKIRKQVISDQRDEIENDINRLDEVSICQYYFKKAEEVWSFLNNRMNMQSPDENYFQNIDLPEGQFSLKNLKEEVEAMIISDKSRGTESNNIGDAAHIVGDENSLNNKLDFFRNRLNKQGDPSSNLLNTVSSRVNCSLNFSQKSPQRTFLSANKEISNEQNDLQLTLQTRSKNIFNMLDRIFSPKDQQGSDAAKDNCMSQSLFKEEIDNTKNFENHGNLVSSEEKRNSFQKNHMQQLVRDTPSKKTIQEQQTHPIGHTPGFEKNKQLKKTFLPNFNPSGIFLDTNLPSFISPKTKMPESSRTSMVAQSQDKKKVSFQWNKFEI